MDCLPGEHDHVGLRTVDEILLREQAAAEFPNNETRTDFGPAVKQPAIDTAETVEPDAAALSEILG